MPSNQLTAQKTLYYQPGEVVKREFTKGSEDLQRVRFTRGAGVSVRERAPQVELVFRDRVEPLRHRYVYHSPDGFEWGYGGSGPAELALNLLAFFIGVKSATRGGLYQDFKWAFIATLDQEDGGELSASTIRSWINAEWEVRSGV